MNSEYAGIFGLLVLALDIWATINIIQSSAPNQRKWIWAIVVLLLPPVGLILWYFRGPRTDKA